MVVCGERKRSRRLAPIRLASTHKRWNNGVGAVLSYLEGDNRSRAAPVPLSIVQPLRVFSINGCLRFSPSRRRLWRKAGSIYSVCFYYRRLLFTSSSTAGHESLGRRISRLERQSPLISCSYWSKSVIWGHSLSALRL